MDFSKIIGLTIVVLFAVSCSGERREAHEPTQILPEAAPSLALFNSMVRMNVDSESRGNIYQYTFRGKQMIYSENGGVMTIPSSIIQNNVDNAAYDFEREERTLILSSMSNDPSGLRIIGRYMLKPMSSVAEFEMEVQNESGGAYRGAITQRIPLQWDTGLTLYTGVGGRVHTVYRQGASEEWGRGYSAGRTFDAPDGWIGKHDPENSIAFVIRRKDNSSNIKFSVEPTDAALNINVDHMSSDGKPAWMWATCYASDIRSVGPVGLVSEELRVEDGFLKGRFGVFYAAKVRLTFLGETGEYIGREILPEVSPIEEFVLNQPIRRFPMTARRARYELVTNDYESIGILGEVRIR